MNVHLCSAILLIATLLLLCAPDRQTQNRLPCKGSKEPMILIYKVAEIAGVPSSLPSPQTIGLPLRGDVNVVIDWGDSSTDTVRVAGNFYHTYDSEGTYSVSITGSLEGFGATDFGSDSDPLNIEMLHEVKSFGDLCLQSLKGAFAYADSLKAVPKTLPSTVTDLSYMFLYAYSFNSDIGAWDVSNVVEMNSLFKGAIRFDQDIGGWNVGNVRTMRSMFERALKFDHDIGKWDVSKVSTMQDMFKGAYAFNRDIGNWNVSNVISMRNMFDEAYAFNQPIGRWNVGRVADMSAMFSRAMNFNQDIGAWDVSRVLSMGEIFYLDSAFNQNLSGWNVPKVLYHQHCDYQATKWVNANKPNFK
jgi:surface protein